MTQHEGQVITGDCAKCGESFEAVLESDGSGGQTAMTVCDSCFQYTVGNDAPRDSRGPGAAPLGPARPPARRPRRVVDVKAEPTRPRRRHRTGRTPWLFGMTDHDEMTGCAGWNEPLPRRTGQLNNASISAELAAFAAPRCDEPTIRIVDAIACARCGARGVPIEAGSCPRCGIGGPTGWAMRDRLPVTAMGAWRR